MPRSQRASDIARIKRQVRQRDGKCMKCSITAEKHLEAHGCAFDVHRISPGSDYSLEGCVAMCKSCHGGEPKSPIGQADYGNRSGERLQVYLPPDLMGELRRRAAMNRRTLTAEFEMALMDAWGVSAPPAVSEPPQEVKPKRPVGRPRKDGA